MNDKSIMTQHIVNCNDDSRGGVCIVTRIDAGQIYGQNYLVS